MRQFATISELQHANLYATGRHRPKPDGHVLSTPEARGVFLEATDLEYVGFWPRVWATMIDTFIQFIVTAPLLILVYGRNYFSMNGYLQGPADFIISYLLPALIVVAFWHSSGATPGKMALRARIVDATTGGAPSLSQYVGRYIAYFLSIIPMGIGFFWVAFDRKMRGWHDILAGTVVVRSKYRGPESVRFE